MTSLSKPSICFITSPFSPPKLLFYHFYPVFILFSSIKADPSTGNVKVVQLMDKILHICYCILKLNIGQ